MAYDSRESNHNGVIIDDECDKHILFDDTHFFLCGSTDDFPLFLELYVTNGTTKRDLDVSGLTVEGSELYCTSVKLVAEHSSDWVTWKRVIRPTNHFAYGSGEQFATAFMDTGMTAQEAVIATMKRDTSTGGKVRMFTIPKC